VSDVTSWIFADVYEAIAERVPERPALVQGDRVITWRQLDGRADALAADLIAAGLGHQSKVAAYLHNAPEYLETYVAAFKAAMVPLNTNYRYGVEEITYLYDDADVEAVVFHAAFTPVVQEVRARVPRVRRWYVVADETGPGPSWATSYEAVAGVVPPVPRVRPPWGRSPDDLLLLYTGGTTGMPKGVMWRQDDLFNVIGAGGNVVLGVPPKESIEEIVASIDPAAAPVVVLSACPLMHGTGQFSSFVGLNMGGTACTAPSRAFDAALVWDEVERLHATALIIVGQAFAGPLLAELDAHPGRRDLTSLRQITSSGVMWSQENKAGLLVHLPGTILFDSLGSSEAVGLGGSASMAGAPVETARFLLGPTCAVLTDDGRQVEPGSGEQGMLAVSGFIPVGYYKDPEKTARTFRTHDGVRWSLPGDWAEVEADGTVRLLGRGSVCINTGGEKVFPEEVEEALKTDPSVRDAVCVGLPDDRFGEVVCAVVEAADGAVVVGSALTEHVKARLAAFKAPRHVVVVDTIGRAPNGKVDYRGLKALAAERVRR
jgi:fatty-acyl-CoA synthase